MQSNETNPEWPRPRISDGKPIYESSDRYARGDTGDACCYFIRGEVLPELKGQDREELLDHVVIREEVMAYDDKGAEVGLATS